MSSVCNTCNTTNRRIAKYCKCCGTALANKTFHIAQIVGMKDLKSKIQKIADIGNARKQNQMDIELFWRQNYHTVVIGNTGTGKSIMVHVLSHALFNYGITIKEDPSIIDATEYSEFCKNLRDNVSKMKGGVIIIDNVHKLVPAGYSGGQVILLDKLLTEMDRTGGDPIIFLIGLPSGFREYIQENPDVKRRFSDVIELADYTAIEMQEIAINILNLEGFTINDEAKNILLKYFNHHLSNNLRSFSNGHLAKSCVDKMVCSYAVRASHDGGLTKEIISDDAAIFEVGEENIQIDTHQIRENLSQVYCQEDNINQVVDSLDIWYAQTDKIKPLTLFLVGTSGVGKTYTVELLAKALEPVGYEFCYFAMTEFSQEHTVANLIGSPKGYVGSQEEPKLFEALNRTKKLIILFDEIEKAHEKILKALMQLMDKGYLSWSKGAGDFRECIIFFTSNAQMQKMVELKSKYQTTGRSVEGPEFQDAIRDVLVRAQVAPEVCGRINRFVVYNPLTPEAIISITHQEVCKLARRYGLEVTHTAPEYLAEMAKSTAGSLYGARPIQDQVTATIAKLILALKKEHPNAKRIEILKSANGYEAFEADRCDESRFNEETLNLAIILHRKSLETISYLDTHQIRENLSQVYCQEDNINQVVDSLDIWYAQTDKIKPLTLFLVGTSGVGKTYTVELLAKALEPVGYEFCYFAMTEFSQEHTVANLIGSPKGYVGSQEEPKLFEALNRTKKLIILFDEIEKAHEKILKALMQLMDKGYLSWSKGAGDFRECIIFFTSNAQMQKMVELKSKYQTTGRSVEGPEFQDAIRDVLVRAQVAPEVCGRINRFVVYNPLTPEAIISITHQEVCKLARRYGLEVTHTAPEYLAEMAKSTAGSLYGARPIQDQVTATIAKLILALKKEHPNAKRIEILKSANGYEAFEADKMN